LRNRLLRNWAIGELAGEYLHAQQVACGEAAHVRELLFDIRSEAVNDFSTPGCVILPG
jgi:hypothetical protein